jgi:nucleotide-binding universal stress UspA family protein
MAEPERILVPMDGSPLSKRALRIAREEHPDAAVTVLHVVDPTSPGYSYPMDIDLDREPLHGSEEWYERSRELADDLFAEVAAIAEEYGTEVATDTTVGEPGRAVVEYAAEHDVDEICIGSHGRGDEDLQLLGTVTETVVFRSPVRVLLVR